jgi:hypothetical protein
MTRVAGLVLIPGESFVEVKLHQTGKAWSQLTRIFIPLLLQQAPESNEEYFAAGQERSNQI